MYGQQNIKILANISDYVHEFGRYQNQDSNSGNLEKQTGFIITHRNARSWTQNNLLVVLNSYFTAIHFVFLLISKYFMIYG